MAHQQTTPVYAVFMLWYGWLNRDSVANIDDTPLSSSGSERHGAGKI